jgi:hypothetical protein
MRRLMVCIRTVAIDTVSMACEHILSTILMIKPISLERRAVGSNMVLNGWFLHGICICRFTATQIKAEYHGR